VLGLVVLEKGLRLEVLALGEEGEKETEREEADGLLPPFNLRLSAPPGTPALALTSGLALTQGPLPLT
jgi:hypothetical protein